MCRGNIIPGTFFVQRIIICCAYSYATETHWYINRWRMIKCHAEIIRYGTFFACFVHVFTAEKLITTLVLRNIIPLQLTNREFSSLRLIFPFNYINLHYNHLPHSMGLMYILLIKRRKIRNILSPSLFRKYISKILTKKQKPRSIESISILHKN
jgi:hypothetical protein